MEVIAKVRQSLLDIALQETGNADKALQIAIANNMSATNKLAAGDVLNIPDSIEKNMDVLEVYREKCVSPATAPTTQQEALNPSGGIGYMSIEIDFIVS